MSDAPRRHHEKGAEPALALLRVGPLTKLQYEDMACGSRLAPAIDCLRNHHGFDVGGDGSVKNPHSLVDRWSWPSLVKTSIEHKEAYYASNHWKSIRAERWERDGYQCVLCGSSDDLQCHHVAYRLFAEPMEHLMTVCDDCHGTVHGNSAMAFPPGICVEHVETLGLTPHFPEWTRPPMEEVGEKQMEIF